MPLSEGQKLGQPQYSTGAPARKEQGRIVCLAGDVYAHNILVGESAMPTLCDYGEQPSLVFALPEWLSFTCVWKLKAVYT